MEVNFSDVSVSLLRLSSPYIPFILAILFTEETCETTFSFLAMPGGLRDLSSPTRDLTQAKKVEASSPNHWISREVPKMTQW